MTTNKVPEVFMLPFDEIPEVLMLSQDQQLELENTLERERQFWGELLDTIQANLERETRELLVLECSHDYQETHARLRAEIARRGLPLKATRKKLKRDAWGKKRANFGSVYVRLATPKNTTPKRKG